MKKITFLLFPLLIIFISGQCQEPQSSLLWRISGNGLEQPSYLFGTMHVSDPRLRELPLPLKHALDSAATLAVEVDLSSVNPLEAMDLIQMDTTLYGLLGEEDFRVVQNYVSKEVNPMFGMIINNIKPFFVMGLLMQSGEALQAQDATVLDLYLVQQAREQGKEVVNLETLTEQVVVIDQIPLEQQAQMLLEQVRDTATFSSGMDVLLEAYLQQDLAAMMQLAEEEEGLGEYESAFVQERNHTMAQRIDSLLKETNLLVAVGALHLPGEEGLIKLLQEKGYNVQPVIAPFAAAQKPEKKGN